MFVKIKVRRHLQLVSLLDGDWLSAFGDGGNRFTQLYGLIAFLVAAHAHAHAVGAVRGVRSNGLTNGLSVQKQFDVIASIMQMTLFAMLVRFSLYSH